MKSRAICKNIQVLFTIFKLPISKLFAKFGKSKSPKSILVLCIAHIGDVLCLVPSLHLLRALHPNAKISVLVPPPLIDFLKRNPLALDLIPYDEKDVFSNLKLYLKLSLYDEAYAFWAKRELLLARAIGTKKIISYEKHNKKHYHYLGDMFYAPPNEVNVERHFQSLILAKEGEKATKVLPTLHYAIDQYFPRSVNIKRDKVVILSPCCQSPCRECPPAYWNKIAAYVKQLGYHVIFSGKGQKESNFVDQCDPTHEYEHAIGSLSLGALADKLLLSSLLITVDTGILHLAKFTGIKILVLCGGSEPLRIAPSNFYDKEVSKDNSPLLLNNVSKTQVPFYAIRSQYQCKAKTPHCLRLLPKYCYHFSNEGAECMKALNVEKILEKAKEILAFPYLD